MRIYTLAFTTFLLVSCGGGGGGGSAPSAPTQQNITVSITTSADSAEINSSINLTWSSTLATSCSASGSWSGSKGTSGSESLIIGVGGSNTFSLSCSATGANSGSASTTVNGSRYFDGKVFDGYIRGAEVFVDTNDNLTLDANEASVTTDNQGGFTKLLFKNGTLVSIGGIDSDTGADLSKLTLVHKLEGYETSKLASPFTTMIAYMSDASTINAALGIDASINLLTTDPIPNLGEGIYDQMYEKGNQLTVLSYTLQNHSAAVDSTSELYFQAIADQLEESYAANQVAVNIEDPTFISNVIDKAETLSATNLSSDEKANLNTVLSSIIPLLKVYPDASTTASIQRFAFSTLQNDVKDSSVMIGNTSTTLAKYENNVFEYVATDQGIDEATINSVSTNSPVLPISSSDNTSSSSGSSAGSGSSSSSGSSAGSGSSSSSGSSAGSGSSSSSGSSAGSGSSSSSGSSAGSGSSSSSGSSAGSGSSSSSGSSASTSNQSPQINGLSTIFYPNENQTSVITVNASDPETSNLSYSLSGDNASLFEISSSGVIVFKSAPDYENPTDTDKDNSYQINVLVSDGDLLVSQAISILVQNLADLVSGIVVDGYVAGATVFQDLNNNKSFDSGEPNASTNALGGFSLTPRSIDINAPIRVVNGFDLASNEIHPSIMDISVSESGSYIITPISTLVGRLKVKDTSLLKKVPESMVAGSLGISLTDSPNNSILGFDPISYFNGSDSTLASKARPVFAASQLLMSLGGGNYSVHKYIVDQALSSLSTTLSSAAGSSITLSSSNDLVALKQDAYDAIFNGYIDTELTNNPPINSIQLRNNKAVVTDYLNGSSSNAVNYSLYGIHDGSTTLVADLVGAKLDYDNLKQVIVNDGTGTPMDPSFELASIPAAGSGSTGVTIKLFHGDDSTQGANEDYLQIALTANWESDGTSFTIPATNSIQVSFFDRGGSTVSFSPTIYGGDLFTVTQDDPNGPPNLSLRLSKLFNALPTEVTFLSSFLDDVAEFTYLVEFDNFTIYDHLDNTFTKIQGTFEVDANPGITVFADDIHVHENATSKNISFYLSQAAASDVTLDYAIADASTASSSDYTLSSGTITIPAGSMSTTLSIPVTNDTTLEAQEEIRLTLSNVQNAVLGRSSVSAFITDSEEILASSTQKVILADKIFKDSKASINAYIKNKLDTTTVIISGTSSTYSQVLINNSITTDIDAYLNSMIDDYEVMGEALISSIMTKVDAYIDSQLSNFASYNGFSKALTQLNSGIKGLNMSQIVNTNINPDGSFPSGQNATTLQTALDGKVNTLVTLAADTVGDILGDDTNANFPNANVVMGTNGNETINGTSGSDLIASFNGVDTVNGLAGNDKILGGTGVDTLNGGDGNDHIYGYTEADTLNGNSGNDLIYGGKGNDTIDGDAGDDSLYGEAGNDTLTSGAGTDTLIGSLGDDSINIDASGTKTVNGGAGTDTLDIDYTGITSLMSFDIVTDNASPYYTTLTDSNGGSIAYEMASMENLTVNSIDYTKVTNENSYWNAAQDTLIAYSGMATSSSDIAGLTGFSASDNLTIRGSDNSDSVEFNLTRNSAFTANLTLNTKGGTDEVLLAQLKNGDSIDLGAGDDLIWPKFTNSNGTPAVAAADLAKLDGGAGTDTMNFNFTGNNTSELNLTTGGATNFENITGSPGGETIKGDDNVNILKGGHTNPSGSDTIYGYGGNDILWAGAGDSNTNTLYGGAGNDRLVGENGDDTLDGGTGADIISTGFGSDTIVIRSGDGGATQSDGDTIETYDGFSGFTDRTDSFGLDGITFTELTIEQSGNDTVIKEGSNFLTTLKGISASNITILDFQSADSSNQTLNGDSSDNTILGGSGDDTFNGGAGSDTLYGWGGDDTFNIGSKSGAYSDIVNGGAGTDTLDIDYTGITSLMSFDIVTDNASPYYTTLTDSNGGSIAYEMASMENLTVNSIDYTKVTNENSYWNAAQDTLIAYSGMATSSSDIAGLTGFSASDNLTIRGSDNSDSVEFNLTRNSAFTANLTLNTKGGTDEVLLAQLKNGDSIDLGAGDDLIWPKFTNSNGTPAVAAADLAKLDGGAGTDTMNFNFTGNNTSELNLTTGGATNFENITGSPGGETIKGDDNVNILKGGHTNPSGSDTIYGYGGNDILWAGAGDSNTNTLYGGAGNDRLVGENGDDTLDGGTGADIISTGFGSDTIVIRSGDGGASITDADTVETYDGFSGFTDGTDIIGLDGLQYSELTVEQGTGSYSSYVVIKVTATGEFLIVIKRASASSFTSADFNAI